MGATFSAVLSTCDTRTRVTKRELVIVDLVGRPLCMKIRRVRRYSPGHSLSESRCWSGSRNPGALLDSVTQSAPHSGDLCGGPMRNNPVAAVLSSLLLA